jgi:hypothetical protein
MCEVNEMVSVATSSRLLITPKQMEGIRSLMLPKAIMAHQMASMQSKPAGKTILATSSNTSYDLSYYVKGALAGGICCAITHGALWYIIYIKSRIGQC